MSGSLTLETLKGAAAEGEIDTVLAVQPDMQGRLMGKRFHIEFFLDDAWKGTHSCAYLQATNMEMDPIDGFESTSWSSGYGDYVMKPDLSTLRRLPWLDSTALVICDLFDVQTGVAVPHSPRAILKKQIDRLKAAGMKACMASELEFHLFRETYEEANNKGYRQLTPISSYNEDYHIFQTSKEEDVMRAIRNGLQGANIPVENSKGEAGAGQEEINVRYTDALSMADRHVIIKNACKEIAWSKGHALSFMAKWNTSAAGSSSHIHQSLRSLDDKPVFHDPDAKHGMSGLMQNYLAGQLHHSSEITAFLAPSINSYKRFRSDTFAPTKAIWSVDNRTAGYRVCGAKTDAIRIECRVGGADLNPYLAMAALLASGLAGIEDQRTLEPEFVGDAYRETGAREIPTTLRSATNNLDASTMLRAALGGDVVNHYVHAARCEQFEYDRRVTDWEVSRGFERS